MIVSQPSLSTMQPQAPQPVAPPKKGPDIGTMLGTAGLAGLYMTGAGGAGSLLNSLGEGGTSGVASNIAGKLLQGQAKGTINGELANKLISLGVDNFNDIPHIAEVTTGQHGALNKHLMAALDRNGHSVDMSGFERLAQDLVDNDIDISSAKGKKLLQIMTNVNKTPAAVKGIMGEPNAVDAMDELRTLEGLKSQAYQKYNRSGDPEQQSIYRILRLVSDEMKDRIFSGPDGSPLPLDDHTKQDIVKDLEPLKESHPDIYDNLSKMVGDTGNLVDVRGLQSDIVQSQIAHEKMLKKQSQSGSDVKSLLSGSPLTLPLLTYGATKNPMAALSAGLLQAPGTNVGATSILRNLSK